MSGNGTTLTFDEVSTAKAAIRVIRYLTVLVSAVALPALVVLATPLVGWALLTAILFSPLILAYVLFAAARQAEVERRQAHG